MARVFITGSSDGLGLLAGKQLVEKGHNVVLHARNATRADDARRALPKSDAVVVGDVSVVTEIKAVADQVNKLGRFDAVIHNVGIGPGESSNKTADGLSRLFAVNVVAPYLLTALITRPDRLIYLSSMMHQSGDAGLDDLQWDKRRWNGSQAYSDSKLYDLMLALCMARRWPKVLSNAVDPGWVPTHMGGAGAPDDLQEGAATQVWLAVSNEPEARATGGYFFHRARRRMNAVAGRSDLQDRLMDRLRDLTKIEIA